MEKFIDVLDNLDSAIDKLKALCHGLDRVFEHGADSDVANGFTALFDIVIDDFCRVRGGLQVTLRKKSEMSKKVVNLN
jgi:hypothetical protein